ncbi:MAG: hypothetical protein HC786_09155 [Richelia sp. CSU_2_1]|nr:hypothetical protein [Richelia sp. CSU_2_1]
MKAVHQRTRKAVLKGRGFKPNFLIITDTGNARNNINVLSSDVIIACGMGTGTASEIALALKANKQVILLNASAESKLFFKILAADRIFVVNNVGEAVDRARQILADRT